MTTVPGLGKLLGCTVAALLLLGAGLAAAAGQLVNTDAENLAIEGYDPVAYFTEGRAVPGDPAYEHRWQDARWRFANAEHLALFMADPERYAPRYGGFCAGAMSVGFKSTIDPEAWVIIDDKLFLAFRKEGIDRIAADPDETLARADAHWERLRDGD